MSHLPYLFEKLKALTDTSILKCSPKCDACTKRVMQVKPAFYPKWKKEKRAE